MEEELKTISKFMSLVLRHKPEAIGLQLDSNGWADVAELIAKSNAKNLNITLDMLKLVVETNEKKRFAFNDDKTKIRANQGHSVVVDVELKLTTPPDVLYHGTALKNREEILSKGLNKMSRLHVHLSQDIETAKKVGGRHGKPMVLVVDAKQMHADGNKFYLSENGVWLVQYVPTRYIKEYEG